MKSTFATLALIVALAGCATPAPQYGPALRPGDSGFSETRIETDRFRVSYRTAAGGAATAQDFALLRAAELTLQNGYDWFVVTQRGVEPYGRYGGSGPRVGVGIGGFNFGRNSGVSIGTGVGFDLGGSNNGSGAAAHIEVRLGRGAKPADPNAYDARSVERSLRRPPA
jgi:hypothetical protein